jgi:hypothetical protein
MTPSAKWSVLPTGRSAVRHLIRQHYLNSWPGVTVAILGLFVEWQPCGVIVFALGPRETEKRYGVACWELARLYLIDELGKNSESWFISRAIKWVTLNHPEIKCLISYADPEAGHSGTIYRAANWIEDGRTDNERKTARFDYQIEVDSLFGSIPKRISRRSHLPDSVAFERIRRVSKFRFLYWMEAMKNEDKRHYRD